MKRLISSASSLNVSPYINLLKEAYESGSNYRTRFQYLKDRCIFYSNPIAANIVYTNLDEYSKSQTNAAVVDSLNSGVNTYDTIEFIFTSDSYSSKYSHSYTKIDRSNFIDQSEVYNYLSGYSPVTNCICSYNDVLSSVRHMIKLGRLSKIKLLKF